MLTFYSRYFLISYPCRQALCTREFSDESTVLMTLRLHTRLQTFALGSREENMPTCVTPPEKKIIHVLKWYKQTADDFLKANKCFPHFCSGISVFSLWIEF